MVRKNFSHLALKQAWPALMGVSCQTHRLFPPMIGRSAWEGIADQIGRGLVACNQEQHAEPQQFLAAQALPIHFRLQERAHQVVVGMRAPLVGVCCPRKGLHSRFRRFPIS